MCLLCENRILRNLPIHLFVALEKVYFTQPKISELCNLGEKYGLLLQLFEKSLSHQIHVSPEKKAI